MPRITAIQPFDASAESLRAFVAFHSTALEADPVRHNLFVCALPNAARGLIPDLKFWTLGGPGACALQFPGRPIALGELNRNECKALAQNLPIDSYSGVVGPDRTAQWFARAAERCGARFAAPVPQMIHELTARPLYPGTPGEFRIAGAADTDVIWGWVVNFIREATPHDTAPPREMTAKSVEAGRYGLWIVDGKPVAMAAIGRNTPALCAIASVYTPVHLRRRGYAGSVTAALCDHAFARGHATICLYTDLRNPASNRCYAKIGFRPVCESIHMLRLG